MTRIIIPSLSCNKPLQTKMTNARYMCISVNLFIWLDGCSLNHEVTRLCYLIFRMESACTTDCTIFLQLVEHRVLVSIYKIWILFVNVNNIEWRHRVNWLWLVGTSATFIFCHTMLRKNVCLIKFQYICQHWHEYSYIFLFVVSKRRVYKRNDITYINNVRIVCWKGTIQWL